MPRPRIHDEPMSAAERKARQRQARFDRPGAEMIDAMLVTALRQLAKSESDLASVSVLELVDLVAVNDPTFKTYARFGLPVPEVGSERHARIVTIHETSAQRRFEKFVPEQTDIEDAIAAAEQQPTTSAATILAELDAAGASDIEYRTAFSTGSRDRLRPGETWRSRLVARVAYEGK